MSATTSATEFSENFVLNDQMQGEKTDNMVAVPENSCNSSKVASSENSQNEAEEVAVNVANIIPSRMTIPESTSDFKDWLEGIKMVARLPGGMPVEFRRKLWLALAERYLKRREIDWEIEKVKWFSENWRSDDEELGIQIVKDLHRTGHSLLSGPNGEYHQAKLKRILMGYTRWNPEVGYCQGFNIIGAIILQCMDKNEVDSIKVLIFLIEGLLPTGYFCGSLMGLQVDMAVFRELLGKKLPKLARHLQKLQYPQNEPTSVEPPLINVFTMQWFLTLFCNCLPMTSVLRIWDLIMIEGSDVLLRAALSIWKLLEDRILREVRTADDFYCKMENMMAELLNENIVDSNVMVQLISDLGPIKDLQKLRHKHLTASYNDQKQLKMMYSKAEGDTERLAVANAWQNNRPRRGSQQQLQREQSDREKIALDITILKKQYDKLRERQKQAHIILTSAKSKQNQQQQPPPANVNKLLVGKHAIISKGRKGPPKGAIPPARKIIKPQKTSPSVMATQPPPPSSEAMTTKGTAAITKEVDTLHWKNNPNEARRRKNSLTWKEINAESPRKARSDSSSYSENSDSESSTSTSLCDDENNVPSLDSTPVRKRRNKESVMLRKMEESGSAKSVANQSPSTLIITTDTTSQLLSENVVADTKAEKSPSNSNLAISVPAEGISSISQLSPMPDISSYFSTAISPIKSPSNYYDFPDFSAFSIGSSLGSAAAAVTSVEDEDKFEVSEQGVTNEFFERVTSSMPPSISTSSSSAATTTIAIHDNSAIKFKHVKQKSLSMEEETTCELFRINRSFSDGTIISNDAQGGDILQRIISENSKILTRFSNDSLTSSTRTAIVETILEEGKSSEENSSECEEIAAIDVVEECPATTSVQDIADIALESQKSEITKPSATLSLLSCNATPNDDDDVTVQNEKSMNGENSKEAVLATLHTTCNVSAAALTLNNNDDSFAQKSLPLKDVRAEEIEVISPKFNEISDLVDKLKRVMESDLEKTQEVASGDKPVVSNDVSNGEVKVVAEIEVKDEGDNNKSNGSNKDAVSVKITINCENENVGSETKVGNDLEKSSHEQETKIDDKIESETKPNSNSELEKCQPIDASVNNEKIKPAAAKETEVPPKDSEKILEKLNFQLQRYEDTEKSPTSVILAPRTPSNERTTDYKKELEVLLKEREIEKRSKSPTYRYEESPQPPPIINSSPSPYDHEPRNEIRRRDIASLESTQNMRRPFKSSPSSSLSSSPSNIHSTLSSIQNTIKTLDSACQRSEIYNYKKLDKAMESIEKICESDREWNFYKRSKTYESPPSFKIDDILSSPSTSRPRAFIDDRDLSPIRSTFMRYESENNVPRKPKTPELDPNYLAKLRCLSTEDYIAGRFSPSREKTPVDRYSRIDRSPTSPSLSSRFLKSPTGDRASKSAENSPSRYGGESNLSTRYTRYSPSSTSHYDMDIKAESMSNLSFKSSALTENNKKYYDFEWEKTSNRRKYDI